MTELFLLAVLQVLTVSSAITTVAVEVSSAVLFVAVSGASVFISFVNVSHNQPQRSSSCYCVLMLAHIHKNKGNPPTFVTVPKYLSLGVKRGRKQTMQYDEYVNTGG